MQGTLSCGLSRCSGIFITWFFKKLAPLKLHTRRILLETILIAKGGKATGSKGHASIIRKAQLLLDETLPVLLILLELLTVSSWQNTSLCPFKNKEIGSPQKSLLCFCKLKGFKVCVMMKFHGCDTEPIAYIRSSKYSSANSSMPREATTRTQSRTKLVNFKGRECLGFLISQSESSFQPTFYHHKPN